jgi:hypothetical protein
METNILLTTAFEIECRTTSTGLLAFNPALHYVFGSRLSVINNRHFMEIDGDVPLTFLTEACDA